MLLDKKHLVLFYKVQILQTHSMIRQQEYNEMEFSIAFSTTFSYSVWDISCFFVALFSPFRTNNAHTEEWGIF